MLCFLLTFLLPCETTDGAEEGSSNPTEAARAPAAAMTLEDIVSKTEASGAATGIAVSSALGPNFFVVCT